MSQRPAKQLETELKSWVDVAKGDDGSAIIPILTLQNWLKLAKKVNASMRLDGSALSKRKTKK